MRWGEFWRPYIGQAMSGEIHFMMLIGTLIMATAMFAGTLVNTK
jgi:hypothetical protein